jgi:hypothetical protein
MRTREGLVHQVRDEYFSTFVTACFPSSASSQLRFSFVQYSLRTNLLMNWSSTISTSGQEQAILTFGVADFALFPCT